METLNYHQLLKKISIVCNHKKTGLHEPIFSSDDIKSVNQSLYSSLVSSSAGMVSEFERNLKKYVKSKYCIATINGTAALHISLLIVGVKKNDEVLVPPFSFVSTANSILYCNAIPHFVDINTDNLGIDTKKLNSYLKSICKKKNGVTYNKKTGNIIRAIIPVHVFGHAVDMKKLIKICKYYNIKIVEDAAEALGSFYEKKHLGTLGDVGIISFNGNKIITTGGGGAIITNNKKLAKKAKHLVSNSKIDHDWEYNHDQIGYNYRMPSLNAALGCSQLKKLKNFLKDKIKIYNNYRSKLEEFGSHLSLMKAPAKCKSNYWLNTIILKKNDIVLRNKILSLANNKNIRLRPIWNPINTFKHFKKCPQMKLENVKKLKNRIINLPSGLNIYK